MKKKRTAKPKPFYTGTGTYNVIAPTKAKVEGFVDEIDQREGQRPGITGVDLSKPKNIKKRTNMLKYLGITSKTPKLR